MFERSGRTMVRWWWAGGLAVAFVVFGGRWGAWVFGSLTGEGFDDPAGVREDPRPAPRRIVKEWV